MIEDAEYPRNSEVKNIDISSLYTGKPDEHFQDFEALSKLREEINALLKVYNFVTGVNFSSLIISPLAWLGLANLLSASASLEYFRTVARLHDTLKMLLDNFHKQGIKITPRVQTNSAIIDLLVRTPDRRMFALMLRSTEDKSVKWREDLQVFTVSKKGKSAKKNYPLTRTMEDLQTIIDLKKKKDPLMGKISTERNVPLIKAIVLAPGAKIVNSELSELWTDFGEARALKISTTSITYVVEYDNLVNFLLPRKK